MDLEVVQQPPNKRAKVEEGAAPGHFAALATAPEAVQAPAEPNAAPEPALEGTEADIANENNAQNQAQPTVSPQHNGAPATAAADQSGPSTAAAPQTAVPVPPSIFVPPAVTPAPAPLDTFCTREQRHIDREKAGELRALYVQNDGHPDSGRFLVGLKNVFSKCLPNMPKTYITRLIFDRRHRSVIIVRNSNKVIGGITYRPFHDRRFAEIAFCAVAQTLQVSGFGTRLMNWTKHYARENDNCEYFLTYADNAAVGYFSKQGFTKNLSMPRERWHGYIKDYDGGTLMECYIHPTLPFTDFPSIIAAQRQALDSTMRQYTTAHIVRPGLNRWKEGGEGGALPIGEIPGVKEAGWTEATAAAAVPRCQLIVGGKLQPMTPQSLAALQSQLLDQLEQEKELIWPFLKPVSASDVPDYYDVIKNPIDISKIRQRLQIGHYYITMDIFVGDVLRMFNNAKHYNAPETVFYKSAQKLSQMFQTWVNSAVHYDVMV